VGNCREGSNPSLSAIAPVAQSVERIHGKENLGLLFSSRDQQEKPFVQVIAHRSVWIK
jgi:hypothetical protein